MELALASIKKLSSDHFDLLKPPLLVSFYVVLLVTDCNAVIFAGQSDNNPDLHGFF